MARNEEQYGSIGVQVPQGVVHGPWGIVVVCAMSDRQLAAAHPYRNPYLQHPLDPRWDMACNTGRWGILRKARIDGVGSC
jgi:hypothetical protein